MPDASTRFGIGKPMLIDIDPRYTQEIRGKIVAAGGHLQVKNCTEIYLRRGSAPTPLGELTALPRPPSWWGMELADPPRLGSPFSLTWKNAAVAHGVHHGTQQQRSRFEPAMQHSTRP